jgi:hypothetical protein
MRLSNATPLQYCTSLIILQSYTYTPKSLLWKLESEARHTTLVLIDRGSAVFLGILRIAEEHTFVSASFLVFAYAAGLLIESQRWLTWKRGRGVP